MIRFQFSWCPAGGIGQHFHSTFSALLGINNTPADKSHHLDLCLQMGFAASTEIEGIGIVWKPLVFKVREKRWHNPRRASGWGWGTFPSLSWISAFLVLLVALWACNEGQGAAAMSMKGWDLLSAALGFSFIFLIMGFSSGSTPGVCVGVCYSLRFLGQGLWLSPQCLLKSDYAGKVKTDSTPKITSFMPFPNSTKLGKMEVGV